MVWLRPQEYFSEPAISADKRKRTDCHLSMPCCRGSRQPYPCAHCSPPVAIASKKPPAAYSPAALCSSRSCHRHANTFRHRSTLYLLRHSKRLRYQAIPIGCAAVSFMKILTAARPLHGPRRSRTARCRKNPIPFQQYSGRPKFRKGGPRGDGLFSLSQLRSFGHRYNQHLCQHSYL